MKWSGEKINTRVIRKSAKFSEGDCKIFIIN